MKFFIDTANVDDIRWCVEKRYHRASGCKQVIWSDKLPYDEDIELCAIPEYKVLVKEYKQIAYEKKQAMIAARPKEIPSQDIPVPKPNYDQNPKRINFDQGGVLSKSIKIQNDDFCGCVRLNNKNKKCGCRSHVPLILFKSSFERQPQSLFKIF